MSKTDIAGDQNNLKTEWCWPSVCQLTCLCTLSAKVLHKIYWKLTKITAKTFGFVVAYQCVKNKNPNIVVFWLKLFGATLLYFYFLIFKYQSVVYRFKMKSSILFSFTIIKLITGNPWYEDASSNSTKKRCLGTFIGDNLTAMLI